MKMPNSKSLEIKTYSKTTHYRMICSLFKMGLLSVLITWMIGCKGKSSEHNIPTPVPGDSSQSEELNYIFKSGTGGYRCFRIPALVTTTDGTLLAFAEARKNNCSDEGDIDLVLKRSTDGGKTWGQMMVVWDEGDNTAGNPAPVVDRNTGKIHLLMSWNLGEDDIGEINEGTSEDTRRVFYSWSDDDGLHWSEPEEITSSVKKSDWGWYATGPVHGIQIRNGDYKDRLVIPCDFIETGANRKGYSHIIYSDDGGKTWELGGIAPQAGSNESTVAELSDGSLMLNMRNGDPFRLVSTSNDGGETWGEVKEDYALTEPTCQGSLLSEESDNKSVLLFSNPASRSRKNMTIKMSENDGETWSRSYTVYPGPAAYSDIAMVTEKKVGILFEAGEENPYGGISFKVISLTDIQ